MKRFIAVVLMLAMLLSVNAFAARRYYMSYGDSGEPIGWFQDYLGVWEEIDVGYSGKTEPYFGDVTLRALRAFQRAYGLTVSGKLDAKTLYFMCDLPYYSAKQDPFVWISMHGGVKYHYDWTCSNLYEPREVPETVAYALGFNPCARCCY